jgi:hypothetical protein
MGSLTFITVFTRVHILLGSDLKLPCYLHLGAPSDLFPSGLLSRILHAFLLFHACYIPLHFFLLDLIWWRIQIMKPLMLFSLSHSYFLSLFSSPCCCQTPWIRVAPLK